jgi:hypothetical protein
VHPPDSVDGFPRRFAVDRQRRWRHD